MSLVICSNKEKDGADDGLNSVFDPWSFKNGLSSTYVIPKNAQVGLHSCKVNINGTATLTAGSSLYQYYGELIDPDVAGKDNINLSTAEPIRCPMVDDGRGVINRDPNGVASLLETQMNKWVFHPNLRDKVDVDVKLDAATTIADGYTITYDLYNDESTSTLPAVTDVWTHNPEDINNVDVPVPGETYRVPNRFDYPSGVLTSTYPVAPFPQPSATVLPWNYSIVGASGVFKSLAHNGPAGGFGENSMISTSLPLSLYNGEFEVNVSNVNASDQDWTVGLTRFSSFIRPTMEYAPSNFNADRGPGGTTDAIDDKFFDFAVRRSAGLIYLQQTVINTSASFDPTTNSNSLFVKNLNYWELAGSTFAAQYDMAASANTLLIDRVKFKAKGQRLVVDLLDTTGGVHNLYTYDPAHTKDQQLKPISQACWNLHPLLLMDTTDTDFTNEMYIEKFKGCKDITNYSCNWGDTADNISSPIKYAPYNTGGWYEYQDMNNGEANVLALELRYWNDQNDVASGPLGNGQLNYAGVPSTGANRRIGHLDGVNAITPGFQNVLLPGPSTIYPSRGNLQDVLGFIEAEVETFTVDGAGATDVGLIFTSNTSALLINEQSIFVRLDNFTQLTKNAFQGNNSAIIAHLPMFDGQVQTGRLYYEPSEIAWIDLNNAYEQSISSFDISFCYVNEQYVRALTGQSIVVLMFRSKPSKSDM